MKAVDATRETLRIEQSMNPYFNLPAHQWFTQRLVDQFNADEGLWEKLAPRRRARRKLLRRSYRARS